MHLALSGPSANSAPSRQALSFWPQGATRSEGWTSECSTGPHLGSGSVFYLDSLFYSLPPEPAWLTRQEHSQTNSKNRRHLAARATRGGEHGPTGIRPSTRDVKKGAYGQKPRTLLPYRDQKPPQQSPARLPGEEFHSNLGADRAQRHAWSPEPQQDWQMTGARDEELVTQVCPLIWAGTRETCTALGSHGEEGAGSLHRAQRASKATLNSFSLLVLFFVWLGIVFLLFF